MRKSIKSKRKRLPIQNGAGVQQGQVHFGQGIQGPIAVSFDGTFAEMQFIAETSLILVFQNTYQ